MEPTLVGNRPENIICSSMKPLIKLVAFTNIFSGTWWWFTKKLPWSCLKHFCCYKIVPPTVSVDFWMLCLDCSMAWWRWHVPMLLGEDNNTWPCRPAPLSRTCWPRPHSAPRPCHRQQPLSCQHILSSSVKYTIARLTLWAQWPWVDVTICFLIPSRERRPGDLCHEPLATLATLWSHWSRDWDPTAWHCPGWELWQRSGTDKV